MEEAKNGPYGTFVCLGCGETHGLKSAKKRRFCDVCIEIYKVVAGNVKRSKRFMSASQDEQMDEIVRVIKSKRSAGAGSIVWPSREKRKKKETATAVKARNPRTDEKKEVGKSDDGEAKTCLFCGRKFHGTGEFCRTCRAEGYDDVYAVTGRPKDRRLHRPANGRDPESSDGWRGQRILGGGSVTRKWVLA